MLGLKFRKGAFFSMDALVAISILLLAYSAIISISPQKTYETSEYQQMHYLAEDAMQVFSNTKFDAINESLRNEILLNTPELTNDDLNKDVIDIIGLLWSLNKTDYANNITQDVLGPILSGTNYSLKIYDYKSDNPTQIYPAAGAPLSRKSGTSVFRLVSGYKENSNHTGFVARAYVASAVKKTQSYAYFGGFEGNGNITKVLVLPSSIDAINEIYVELDVPSNFTLMINGMYSGTYNITNRIPLRANNWTVPSAYNANLEPGNNNITIGFTDINSAYVGGGFIRVKYNTSVMDTADLKLNPDKNITERYYFPGIDGIINIYSSFYVPGALKSLGAQIHYASNYTVYLILGNSTIYENSTNTTENIYLNNGYLSSILNYSNFFQTMPIRFGTKNISGMSDGSDVVLITDLSGSMSGCDVNASASPDCNSGLGGIQHKRIDVAKESDSEFVNTILGNPGQMVGLIAYSSTTLNSRTVNLTDNNATLISKINAYTEGGCTCISCGIQSSTDMLASTINITTLVSGESAWHYNDSFLDSTPPNDPAGRNWTHQNYSYGDLWKTGSAVFGNGSDSVPITTGILSSNSAKYPDLWDMAADKATKEVDFTSGMNSTASTFGLGAGNDGWDLGAQYDYDNTKNTYYNASGGKLVFLTAQGSQNQCTSRDCSGGYGIQISITPEDYAVISSGGIAYLSFDYSWNTTRSFDTSDDVWIKARWTSPTSNEHYLGTELGSDGTLEIDRRDNPANNFGGSFSQNITSWIEGAGTYYLDFGGKLRTSSQTKWGNFSFDNVLIEITNTSDTVYFRKNFTIENKSSIGKGIIKILSDDSAEVYFNGRLVLNNTDSPGEAKYWNAASIINKKYILQGQNIIGVKLYNKGGASRFDLAFTAINDSRNKAILVMSDGEANTLITDSTGCNSQTTAPIDAINRSCAAYETYGIISHAVSFGADTDGRATLQAIADCGHGDYYVSNNADDLKDIYKDIANGIISYSTQTAAISGEIVLTKLFTDSFIEYNYTPATDITYGNISLIRESGTFGNTSGNYSVERPKNGSYDVPGGAAIIDAKATSYSSDYWTNMLKAKDAGAAIWTNAFDLSAFGNNYLSLGDPYIVNIPVSIITPGQRNYVQIDTATNSTEQKGGSPDNRVIYTIKVKGSVGYGATFNTTQEATDDARKRLNDTLSPLGIDINEIETGTQDVGKIPWMWGPAIMALEVWK